MVEIWNEDCVTGMERRLGRESVDCCITSIPFAALFSYSGKTEDIGNCHESDNLMACQFSVNLRFWFEQLIGVMKPGSITCIHIQQLLTYRVKDGYMGMRDFRGAVITMAQNHGFNPHGEVAIPKNPRNVARRNNLHSLMFATGARDCRALAPAMNDYILFFRKPGSEDDGKVRGIIETEKDIMVTEPSPIIEYVNGGKIKRVRPNFREIPFEITSWDEATGLTLTKTIQGERGINPSGWFTKLDWIRWANGSWDDILEIDTLQGSRGARENDQERHPAVLQLEPIRRCIKLYTNPGDLVLDPFMGIGSTAVVAMEQGRDCVGFELKESFYRMAMMNIRKYAPSEQNLLWAEGV